MNIWDEYNSSKKVVSFDTQDRLDDKLDKVTSMMSKLTAQGSSQSSPFKSKIYQALIDPLNNPYKFQLN